MPAVSVNIDDDGSVTVQVAEDEVVFDEASARLAGLTLDDTLTRACHTALEAWLTIHTVEPVAAPGVGG